MSKHKVEHPVDQLPPADTAEPGPAPVAEAQSGPLPAAPAKEPIATIPVPELELADLKSKAAQAQQHYEQMLLLAADLDNFKKRAARERAEALRYANEGLLKKLVPVLDNFEMAMMAAAAPNTTVPSLQAGVGMIHQQLKSTLSEAGLEEIDAALKPFDPAVHEAVSEEVSDQVQAGHVVRQLREGYRLRERLLRPASVVVAKCPVEQGRPQE
jgi:molecular chaperone GrpE